MHVVQAFTCDCSSTKFTGENCDVEIAAALSPTQDDTTAYIIGAVFSGLVLAAILVFIVVKYQRHQRSLMASQSHPDLDHAPYNLYGVTHIDRVSRAPFLGQSLLWLGAVLRKICMVLNILT